MQTEVMRFNTLLLVSFIAFESKAFSQAKEKTDSVVSFVIVFDKAQATKDGYHLNEYVVDIPQKQAQKLHHKKIRVTGKVVIVRGLDPNAKETAQGRSADTKHIPKPVIQIAH